MPGTRTDYERSKRIEPGKLPGSSRMVRLSPKNPAAERIKDRAAVVARKNVRARQQRNPVNAGEIYRDDLIEAILEAAKKSRYYTARKTAERIRKMAEKDGPLGKKVGPTVQKAVDFLHGQRQLRKMKKKK